MGRLFKFLFYLVVICFLGLAVFAYVGPFFGADFAPQQVERRVPVELDGK